MLIRTLLLALTFTLTGYKAANDLETEKYLNFVAALKNGSSFSYFTVIKVKDLNTGVVKEICTKGKFVLGALLMESDPSMGSQSVIDDAKSKKNRYFEFKNKKALENISFFDYKPELIAKVQKRYDINKAIEIIKSGKYFGIKLAHGEMEAFAHILFNKGYLTGEHDCWGGALEYVHRDGSMHKL